MPEMRASAASTPSRLPPTIAMRLIWIVQTSPSSKNGKYFSVSAMPVRRHLRCRESARRRQGRRAMLRGVLGPGPATGRTCAPPPDRPRSPILPLLEVLGVSVLQDAGVDLGFHVVHDRLQEGTRLGVALLIRHPDRERDVGVANAVVGILVARAGLAVY